MDKTLIRLPSIFKIVCALHSRTRGLAGAYPGHELLALGQMTPAVAAAVDPTIQLDDKQLAHASSPGLFLRS